MSVYSFDTEIAQAVGVNAATIYHNMQFWINKNKANNTNFKDGNWWIYNSVKAWQELFPFMTIRSVRTALQKLVDAGLIEKGEYNQKGYDKTAWYAICQKRQMDLSETASGFVNNDKPIPVSNPISNLIYVSTDVPTPAPKNDYTKEREEAFEYLWQTWSDCKKRIGTKNKAQKQKAKAVFMNNTFPASRVRSQIEKHGMGAFENEVDAMINLAWREHEEVYEDIQNGGRGFFPITNAHPQNFLKGVAWRE